MGKPTGFLDYEREPMPSVSERQRIKNFQEFHTPLEPDKRMEQAGRCMNCGVPFCQSGCTFGGMVSGCPLHNLIPEWNDELYRGKTKEALARLLKVNPFPEFTGRVCPALCEAACTEGLNGDPVTIRENEYSLCEEGYQNGWIRAQAPTVRSGKTIAVIGAGPAGLSVAETLNRRGHSVTVFEKETKPGGLLMFGIPNMKLEKSVIERRLARMEAEGIRFCTGVTVGNDRTAEELRRDFDAVVLCCGSKKPRDLMVEGRQAEGIHFAVDYLTDATKCVIGEIPQPVLSARDRRVVVVGGGDTGNDCVGTAIRQGCRSVTQLEMMPMPPTERLATNPWPQWPRIQKTDYGQQEAIAVFGHDPRVYETTIQSCQKDASGRIQAVVTVKVAFQTDPVTKQRRLCEIPGSETVLDCDLLLIAAGFTGCESLLPEAFGLSLTAKGTLCTKADGYATEQPGVFCAGDARRGQSLVVWALQEGQACAAEVDRFLTGYTALCD